ncbi:hypothetical protein F5H01DRAFT_415613, partial [Linnemannia elongata]
HAVPCTRRVLPKACSLNKTLLFALASTSLHSLSSLSHPAHQSLIPSFICLAHLPPIPRSFTILHLSCPLHHLPTINCHCVHTPSILLGSSFSIFHCFEKHTT